MIKSKGMSVSGQTVVFAVAAVMSVMIIASSTNLLENNLVQERMALYRAEEVAINIGVLSQYDNYGSLEMSFDREYDFSVELTPSGRYNLTMESLSGDPVRAETRLPTDTLNTETGNWEGERLCVEKTIGPAIVPPEVEISEGYC